MKIPLQYTRWAFTAGNLVALVLLMYALTSPVGSTAKHVAYSEFLPDLRAGRIAEVEITANELIGLKKRDDPKARDVRIAAMRLPGMAETALLAVLEERQVRVVGRIENGSWIWNSLTLMLPFFVIILVYGAAWRRFQQGGAGGAQQGHFHRCCGRR